MLPTRTAASLTESDKALVAKMSHQKSGSSIEWWGLWSLLSFRSILSTGVRASVDRAAPPFLASGPSSASRRRDPF